MKYQVYKTMLVGAWIFGNVTVRSDSESIETIRDSKWILDSINRKRDTIFSVPNHSLVSVIRNTTGNKVKWSAAFSFLKTLTALINYWIHLKASLLLRGKPPLYKTERAQGFSGETDWAWSYFLSCLSVCWSAGLWSLLLSISVWVTM